MAPRKGKDKKYRTSKGNKGKISKDLEEEVMLAQKRFIFNIGQIEKKYCSSSSGVVYNFSKEEINIGFDPSLSSGTIKGGPESILKKNLCYARQKFGGAILSTPGPDPECADELLLKEWRKINNEFLKSFKVTVDLNSDCKTKLKLKTQSSDSMPFAEDTSLLEYGSDQIKKIVDDTPFDHIYKAYHGIETINGEKVQRTTEDSDIATASQNVIQNSVVIRGQEPLVNIGARSQRIIG